MNRSLLVSSIAAAVLAGCATEHRVTPAPAPVVIAPAPAPTVAAAPAGTVVVPPATGTVVVPPAPLPPQAGYGRVETIVNAPAAAAGASAPSTLKRIGVRMDNGTVQYMDIDSSSISVGDRVEITTDGKLRFPV